MHPARLAQIFDNGGWEIGDGCGSGGHDSIVGLVFAQVGPGRKPGPGQSWGEVGAAASRGELR